MAVSLLWVVSLYMLGTLSILIFSAGVYVRAVGDHGAWLIMASWSLLTLYAVVGVAAGVAGGVLSAAHRSLDMIESALHAGLSRLPALTQAERESFSVDEARVHYASLVDRMLNQTVGYVSLPRWLDGTIRSWVQDAIVTDFIALCRQRGMTRIPPQEFRNWLLAQGATLALSPVHDQISLWQYALFGLIALLAGGALLLSYVAG
ncbi:MAG TPA: hypothetical protein VJ805_09875 [Nitrospiraceae bacterium]|nr:hypothetical protein [Nitrospiraceae bacterium]